MYTYYIVRAGVPAPDARIAKAISNFGYGNEDVICISTNGYVGEIQTVRTAQVSLNRPDVTDADQLAQMLVDKNTEQLNSSNTQETIIDA